MPDLRQAGDARAPIPFCSQALRRRRPQPLALRRLCDPRRARGRAAEDETRSDCAERQGQRQSGQAGSEPIYSALAFSRASLERPAAKPAQVAQLVEQRTENPRVGGSIPPLGTKFLPIDQIDSQQPPRSGTHRPPSGGRMPVLNDFNELQGFPTAPCNAPERDGRMVVA